MASLKGEGGESIFWILGGTLKESISTGSFRDILAACCVSSVPVQRTLTLVNGDYQEGGQRL